MPKRHEHKTGLFIDIDFNGHTLTLHSEKHITEWVLTSHQAIALGEFLIEKGVELRDFEETEIPPGKTLHITSEGNPGKGN